MQRYFVDNEVGRSRRDAFLRYIPSISWLAILTSHRTPAGSINTANKNLTWGQLSTINAERVMRLGLPFARNQTKENLVHLLKDQVVGQWRDSTYGMLSLSSNSSR
jgi:hypothetical protein